jgi:hypothetical protein
MRYVFADTIRDIKPPVNLPGNHLFLIIIAVILCILLLGVLARSLVKNRDRHSPSIQCLKRPAHETAYLALKGLKAKGLPQLGLVKEYYFRLSGIVRHYLEDRFYLRAPEMTTEEFLYSMRESAALSLRQKNIVRDFLSHCDMVKFAGYSPAKDEIKNIFSIAMQLIDETRQRDNQCSEGRVV